MLENLKPEPKEKEAVIKQWLSRVTRCQNAIDSILIISGDHYLARQTRYRVSTYFSLEYIVNFVVYVRPSILLLHIYRSDWQCIQLLQKFIQHIVMKYDGMGIYANRLLLVHR